MSAHQPLNLTGLGMTIQKVEDILEKNCDASGNDPFHLSDLSKEDNHFAEIAIDFENAGLNVVRVQRLENMIKWKAYKACRCLMFEQRSTLDVKYRLNERYLYHGTAAKIKDICELGLDDKLSGDGCFGKGIYFSDNPMKCTKYANRREGDEGLILCARVILGDAKVYPKGKQDRSLLREPEKKGSFQGFRFYDSVQGHPNNFNEFVVYRAQNVLIEYLVTYSKSSTTKPNHSGGNTTCPNRPKVSAEEDFHHHISMSNSSHFRDKSNSKIPMMPNEQRSLDHSITNSPMQSSNLVPNEDSSSDESDGENNDEDDFYPHEDKSSSDEDGEIQRNVQEDTDSEKNGSGSDTDSNEDLSGKEKDQNTKSFYSCGNAKTEEVILAQKRRMFTELTGEFTEYLVETFLLASEFDVQRAVEMYHQKRKKDAQKRNNPVAEIEQDEPKQDAALGGKSEPDFIQGKTVPEFNSPQWNQMSENDKEVVVNILIENFLAITNLSEANAPVARKILKMTQYNLDQAIVSYYESI